MVVSTTEPNANFSIHFFTIVINGMPFIQYHIHTFRQLPFPWHWHIIEGMAELKHDTGWSLSNGGKIPDTLHQKGLSIDGTSQYIDDIKRKFPHAVSIYRKPPGLFWSGKLEMVNAPLPTIPHACLLFQIDADELWTVEQLCTVRDLFIHSPQKTAAYFYCHYFVGPDLVTATRDTYGNQASYEWLRTWRFQPGDRWRSHEPPVLCRTDTNGQSIDVAGIDPVVHAETREKGLIFQHYAYATREQAAFKEVYYGYASAVQHWEKLNSPGTPYPVFLKDYFPWVHDETQVDTRQSQNIRALAKKNYVGQWRFATRNQRPDEPDSLLFIRTDAIGDNVLASILVKSIRLRYPHADIIAVIQSNSYQLYLNCPYIDKVICFEYSKAIQDKEYRNLILSQIASIKPDIAFNSVYSRHALTDVFALNTGAKQRIAFAQCDCQNIDKESYKGNNSHYTHLITTDSHWKNEISRHVDFLKGLGITVENPHPEVWISAHDRKAVDGFFRYYDINPDKTIVLFPGVMTWVREYRKYGIALADLCKEKGFKVISLGCNYDENSILQNHHALLLQHVPCINLAELTTLTQAAEVIRRCRLAVGAETSLAHIACAVGTPNVIMIGGGHFGRFMPYCTLTTTVCLPLECYGCSWQCKHPAAYCIDDIQPETITLAVRRTLRHAPHAPQRGPMRIFMQAPSQHSFADITLRCREILRPLVDLEKIECIFVSSGKEIKNPACYETSDLPVHDETGRTERHQSFPMHADF